MSSGEKAFVETNHYRRFKEFCDACLRHRYIGVCYGLPGVGKTLSARHYAHWDLVERYEPEHPNQPLKPGAVAFDDVCGSTVVFYTPPLVALSPSRIPNDVETLRRKLRSFAVEKIERELMPPVWAAKKRFEAFRRFVHEQEDLFGKYHDESVQMRDACEKADREAWERIHSTGDPTELILVDEADCLKVAALEQLRSIFDRGDIGMVLIGMPGLEKRLARYPQLYSRVGFVHEYAALSQAEMRKMLAARWWPQGVKSPGVSQADEASVAAIVRITSGNFRLLHRLLTQIGRLLEINNLDSVTPQVVEAARESLVIGAA